MNVAAPTAATLVQALIGPDAATPTDPAAPVAGGDFAMMMAGVATPPVAPAEDAAAPDDAAKPAAKDDDGDGDENAAPDAALLAMLAITPPALPSPPAAAPTDPSASGGADVQAPATISPSARSTARAAALPGAADQIDPADRSPEKAAVTPPAPDGGGQAQAALPGSRPGDPATLVSAMSANAAAAPRPASAATVVRKAIATMLGLKPSIAAAAPDAATSVGIVATGGVESRHAHVAADAPATTEDDHPDATAKAVALPGLSPAAIATNSPATLATDSAAQRHPAADVSAQLGEHHIALAQGDGWLDQLARDISSTAAPDGKLNFRLNPERLGSLHVEVARGAEGAAVRMTTESSATRDILVDAQPQLAAQAQAQGVRIAGTHVDLGAGTGGQGGGGQQPSRAVPQVRALGSVAAPATPEKIAGPRSAAPERYA